MLLIQSVKVISLLWLPLRKARAPRIASTPINQLHLPAWIQRTEGRERKTEGRRKKKDKDEGKERKVGIELESRDYAELNVLWLVNCLH
jgi:hypothetical protein